MDFKTTIQRRTCEPCQRGNHEACAYWAEFSQLNAGAVDAEDFINLHPWCVCYNSSREMHHRKYQEAQEAVEFVEDAMDRLPFPDYEPNDRISFSEGGGVLSDQAIKDALNDGRVMISPYDEDRLGPASYDLSLSPVIGQVFLPTVVDLRDVPENYLSSVKLRELGSQDRHYDLYPGEFILASTIENIGLDPIFAARVEGKSSLARLGLAVHVTGGFIDPGFEGQITLEMVNLSKSVLRLWPGIAIAQIAFIPVVGEVEHPYSERGHYQHQSGPTGSRYRA